jgi:hypothetical protein
MQIKNKRSWQLSNCCHPFHNKIKKKKKTMATAIILFVANQITKKMTVTMPSSSLQ